MAARTAEREPGLCRRFDTVRACVLPTLHPPFGAARCHAATLPRSPDPHHQKHRPLLPSAALFSVAGHSCRFLPPKVTWTDVEEAQTNQKVIQQDGMDFRLIDQFQRRALQLQRFLR